MYSKRLIIACDAYLKVCALLGASALLLDSRTVKFYTTPYSRRTAKFNTVLLIFQIVFGAIRLLKFGNLSNKTDYELFTFNISYVVLLIMCVPLICLLILTTSCKELVDCFNQALNYIFRVRETWVSLSDKEIALSYPTGTFLDWLFGFVAVMVASYSFLGGVAIYLMDILPFQWMSMIPMQFKSRILFCMHLGFYGYMLIKCMVSVGIGLTIAASYVGKLIFCARPK